MCQAKTHWRALNKNRKHSLPKHHDTTRSSQVINYYGVYKTRIVFLANDSCPFCHFEHWNRVRRFSEGRSAPIRYALIWSAGLGLLSPISSSMLTLSPQCWKITCISISTRMSTMISWPDLKQSNCYAGAQQSCHSTFAYKRVEISQVYL